ncbi:MAG: hypothetical protein IJ514_02875 [Clostridia bacterium]|nr:hypothetical protein [Clostridia bacterium]
MSMQKVVERILSDAASEAQTTLDEAEAKAARIVAEASSRAEKRRRETEAEVQRKTESVLEKRAADARLESAKILLREKRKTVDGVYALALARLVALDKEDCMRLTTRLLERYAEEGDEVFLSENFKYGAEVETLPVVERKKLKISDTRLRIEGGMRLVGKVSDKDLSYAALLAADKDENQASLAAELFK